VTWILIALNIVVFLSELGLPQREQSVLAAVYGVVPARYSLPGFPAGPAGLILPLFSAMFLHGGWLHILGNMIYLWVFGDNVEDRMGHGRFLVFYLLVGLIANLVHIYFNPLSEVPTIGASGAIAGVLGAYFLSFPRARVLTLIPIGIFLAPIEVPAILLLFFWFALQVVNGLFAAPAQTVAWWAHVGGFLAGLALAGVFRRRRNPWLA